MALLAAFVLAVVFLLIWLLAREKPQHNENAAHSIDNTVQHTQSLAQSFADVRRALAPFSMLVYRQNERWLNERWDKAQAQRVSPEKGGSFPAWYFDDITERQLALLADDGFTIPLRSLTKGQASDLIGLLEPPEPEDEEVLKFFKAPPEVKNKTRARGEVERLLSDPVALARWNSFPADSLQKETLRCYGVKIQHGLTVTEAQALIESTERALSGTKRTLVLETQAYSRIVMALCGPELCKTNGIKRWPRLSEHRLACDKWTGLGWSLSSLGPCQAAGGVPG